MRAQDIARVESEAGIVATLIFHPDFAFHSENLLPNHFSNRENACLYMAITDLARRGIETIDAYNINEVLASSEAARRYSGEITVENIQDFIETATSISRDSVEEYKMLVDAVLEASFRRDAVRKLQECEAMLFNEHEKNVQQKLCDAVDEIVGEYSSNDEIPQFKEIVDDMWKEICSRQKDGYAGIPFKFPALNDFVTLERGELVIFGAQQKMGKSIMLMNCAVDLMRQGYSVLYIDSELSSRLFTARILAHLAQVEYRRLTTGNYDEIEGARIKGAIDWLKQQQFTHIYMPMFNSQSLYTTVKKVNHTQKLDVLIIDYFKSTADGNAGAFEVYNEMGKLVDLCKNNIAGDMGIAALGAAQATVNNKLADSAKIARNASTIIMLTNKTPEEIEADGTECGNRKLRVVFNRNGAQHYTETDYIDIQFNGDLVTFEQAQQHIPQEPY